MTGPSGSLPNCASRSATNNRVPDAAIVEWAEGQIRQKRDWLENFGPTSKRPRPEGESENKRRDIAMLDAVIEMCKARAAA